MSKIMTDEQLEARKKKALAEIANPEGISVSDIPETKTPKDIKKALQKHDIPIQTDFFLPDIADIPLKDMMDLMDVAPFTIETRKKITTSKKYEVANADITISCSNEYGMATVHDYDICLYLISWLTSKAEDYANDIKKGISSPPPPRTMQTSVYDILKFCKKSIGKKNYEAVVKSLYRLKTTSIDISGQGKRYNGSFSLIEGFQAASSTENGSISRVDITIPEWIYNTVMENRHTKLKTLLKDDYFSIKNSTEKFICRFVAKRAGNTSNVESLKTLYKLSGCEKEFRYFRREVKKAVEKNSISNFDLKLEKGRKDDLLYARNLNMSEISKKSLTLK